MFAMKCSSVLILMDELKLGIDPNTLVIGFLMTKTIYPA